MAVLIFRHTLAERAGMIADAFSLRGIEWHYVDLWNSPHMPLPVEQAQGVVVTGGPMSVNDPLPWLREEERYVTHAIASGVPVLGVCLGAQLLAKCLGARVHRMARKEIGWFPIRLKSAAMSDPLFEGLQREETVFEWHGDTFDLPAGAEWLAESELCPNQAYRHGANLYGVQFHPEVTPQMIAGWCEEDRNCGDAREVEAPFDPSAHQAHMREMAAHLFGRWCDRIVGG